MLEFFLHWNAKGGKISPTRVIHYRDYKAVCISILFNEVSLFSPDCLKCFLPLRCKRLTEYCCHPAGQAGMEAEESWRGHLASFRNSFCSSVQAGAGAPQNDFQLLSMRVA